MTEAKKMIRNNMVYMLSSLVAQSISVLLVPVYTKNMSLDDFGLYNLMITVQILLSIFATLGIASGLTRFFHEFQDQLRIKNTALCFAMLTGALVTLPTIIFSDWIFGILFGAGSDGGQMLVIIMISTLCLSITSIYSAYYNMCERAAINGIANISKSLLLLAVSIVLIIYMDMGLMGALWAQLFAYGSVALVLLISDYRTLKFQIAAEMLKPMLKYSTGLIPGEIASWIYTLIDRYFIKAMLGLASVGVYSMGFRLGALFEPLFLQPFRLVFAAFKYREYNKEGAREKIHRIFQVYTSTAWFAALGVSVFARPGILILSTPDYLEAATVVPLVVAAFVLHGFDEFFQLGIHIANKSHIDSAILAITAGINIVLNMLLIPKGGIHGAAAATVLSAIAMNIIYYRAGQRYYDLEIAYWEGFKPLPAVIAAYAFYLYASGGADGLVENTVISCAVCGGFLLAAYVLNVIPRDIYHMVFQMAASRLKWSSWRG